MKMIPPVVIDESMLVSSSIAETDYPAWSAATAYLADARCIRTSVHSVYQRTVPGTTATPPEDDLVNWVRVGPTSRWAMFDQATGSRSTATGSMSVTISPGMVNSLALLDVSANTATVIMTSDAVEVFRKVVNLNNNANVFDFYSYCFEPILLKSTAVVTDLPPYVNCEITVELAGSGTVSIGTLAVGMIFDLGPTRYGVGLGGIDYSVKATDAFGVTTVTERPEASRMTVPFVVQNNRLDSVMRVLRDRRAKPSVWIGAKQFDSAVVYGYAKDRQLLITYAQVSECSVTIEGLI